MIAINKIPLAQTEKNDPFRKIYEKACELLKKHQEEYTLKFVPALMTKKDPLDPNSRDEYPTGINFMASKRYVCEAGECEFTYYTGANTKKHGVVEFTPRRLDFSKAKTYSIKKDLDMLFFMIFVNDICQVDERFISLQNGRRNPNSQYYVEDLKKEINANLYYEKMVTKVRNLFFDDERGMNDLTVLQICPSYKIETENRAPEELRTQLANTVMQLDSGLKYKVAELEKFCTLFEEYSKTSKAPVLNKEDFDIPPQVIEKAIQLQIIQKTENDTNGKSWVFVPSEGDMQTICTIEFQAGKHMDQLVNGLKLNKEIYKAVLALVS